MVVILLTAGSCCKKFNDKRWLLICLTEEKTHKLHGILVVKRIIF